MFIIKIKYTFAAFLGEFYQGILVINKHFIMVFARVVANILYFFNYYYLVIPNNLLPPPNALIANLENCLYPYTCECTDVNTCKEVSIHFPVDMLYIPYLR